MAKLTKTEVKQKAQDRILGAIANELLGMAESGMLGLQDEQEIYDSISLQAVRLALRWGVTDYPGIIRNGKQLTKEGE